MIIPDLRVELANAEIQRDDARRQLALLQRQSIEALAQLASSESELGHLREQLAEAQADVQALAGGVKGVLDYYGNGRIQPSAYQNARETLARPGVERVMEVTNAPS